MGWKIAPLAEKTLALIGKHGKCGNAVEAAHSFLKEMMEPYDGKPDMTYRYEHSLRVAAKGRQIADGEGWSREPMTIACLLHDIGYPECRTSEDFDHHQDISAQVAEAFLERIEYDRKAAQSICRAIAFHARTSVIPDDATAFELSVRDADDLDGEDIMRTYIRGGLAIGVGETWMYGAHNAAEILEGCREQLNRIEESRRRICGTKTAQGLWEEQILVRTGYFEALYRQMQTTGDMERSLMSGEG